MPPRRLKTHLFSTGVAGVATSDVRLWDGPVPGAAARPALSCDDRRVNRAGQIALPFDVIQAPAELPGTVMAAHVAPTAIQPDPTPVNRAPTRVALAPLYFVRHRRARRYLLRVEPDGRLRGTIPRGGSTREAEAYAARNLTWVAAQRARLTPPTLDGDQRARLRARAVE